MALAGYEVGSRLGVGSFGVVRSAKRCSTGEVFAAKFVSNVKMDARKLQKEIACHKLMDHEHIARLYEVIELPDKDETVLLMELVPGRELFDHIDHNGTLRPADARRLFQQVIAALEHMHEKGVVHRDVKPENILLDELCNAKFVDFGFSTRFLPGLPLTEQCGSLHFAAPELLQRNCSYEGPPVDVWAAGCVLYMMLCGRNPFDPCDNASTPELHRKIKAGQYWCPVQVPSDARDLISRMLVVDAAARISIAEIRRHPWFQEDLPANLAFPAGGNEVAQGRLARSASTGQLAQRGPLLLGHSSRQTMPCAGQLGKITDAYRQSQAQSCGSSVTKLTKITHAYSGSCEQAPTKPSTILRWLAAWACH